MSERGKISTGKEPLLDLGIIDLGIIDFKPTGFALVDGKPAPELSLVEVRGLPADIKFSDFAGKWLLLAFLGHS